MVYTSACSLIQKYLTAAFAALPRACAVTDVGCAAVVTPLADTLGECAPLHSAPSATPYYSLELTERGELDEIK